METMERTKPRPRPSLTPEFETEIVERCQAGDRSVGQVARDFDRTETAVRTWVAQARRADLHRGAARFVLAIFSVAVTLLAGHRASGMPATSPAVHRRRLNRPLTLPLRRTS
jgi:transposase-like protein